MHFNFRLQRGKLFIRKSLVRDNLPCLVIQENVFLLLKNIKVQPSDKPLVATQLKDLIKQCHHSLPAGEFEKYKSLSDRIHRMAKHLHSSYYHEKVADLKYTGSKTWWSNIISLMGRKSKLNTMQNLANQFSDCNRKPLANIINKTF